MPPAPKRVDQRQRRNRTSTSARLEAEPAEKQPLPAIRWSAITCLECVLPSWHHTRRKFDEAEVEPHDFDPAPIDWRSTTLQWWETIWDSPMADEWVDADVPQLMALAILVDQFWSTGDSKIHAEVRMAAKEFGLSPLARRSLQWEVHKVESATRKGQPAEPARRGKPRFSVLSGKSA